MGRVHVAALAGRREEASRLFRRAERFLKRAGRDDLLGKLYMNRGNSFYQEDRYRDADRCYARADRLLAAAGTEEPARAGLLMNRGVTATSLDRFAEARARFEETEQVAAPLGLDHLVAYARYNRAFLERLRGDTRAALDLLETAGRSFAEQGARDMTAATAHSRAEIYLELGMPAEARDLAKEAGAAFAAEGMELDAALAALVEARSLLDLARPGAALPLLIRARDDFTAKRNPARRALVLLELARAEGAAGDPSRAAAHARRARDVFRRRRLGRWESEARALVAGLHLDAGRPGRAERALAGALPKARTLPHAQRQELWMLAGRAALASGRTAAARSRLERAAALLEQGRRLTPGLELRLRSFERRAGVYHDLVTLELAAPRFERLLGLVERARARGFRDLAAGHRSGEAALGRRRELLGSLTRRLEEAEFDPAAGADRDALKRRVLRLEDEILRERRHAAEREPETHEERIAVDPARLRRRLGEGGALVGYFVSGERVLALALTRDRALHRVLPTPASALREAVERARFQLESALFVGERGPAGLGFLRRSAEASLRALHDLILAPVLEGLPLPRRLYLVPHRFLHHAPFECLRDGRGFLDERTTVSRLPLTDFLLRPRPPHRPGPALLAGTLRSGPAFVAEELEAVAAFFPRDRRTVMRDPATADLLAALPRAGVIHLSSHGVFRDDNPAFSNLSTGDGALFLDDVLKVRLRASLVVLSACNTGRVFTGGGEDLSGVAHGFLAAGASGLVASLWRVHDRATRELMEAFYRELTGGADPAEALAAARRSIRERWGHPAFWGGFGAFG